MSVIAITTAAAIATPRPTRSPALEPPWVGGEGNEVGRGGGGGGDGEGELVGSVRSGTKSVEYG